MGTHGLIGFRERDYVNKEEWIFLAERTMDGYNAKDVFEDIVETILKDARRVRRRIREWIWAWIDNCNAEYEYVKIEPSKKRMFIYSEREHDQEYVVLVDVINRTILISNVEYQIGIDKLCEYQRKLRKKKWHIEFGYDTEDLMAHEERVAYLAALYPSHYKTDWKVELYRP